MNIEYFSKNENLLSDGTGYRKPAEKNRVNMNWWHTAYGSCTQNLGDMLSEAVFAYMCELHKINRNKVLNKTKHLYTIGSILFFENQDATVWGTGCMHSVQPDLSTILHQKYMRHLDIRAVRGPKTREQLLKLHIKCPEVYGDPAILMPLIYTPKRSTNEQIVLITHYKDEIISNIDKYDNIHVINMLTQNWKEKIDVISSAKRVISSSLHGLILAESYEIPAILLQPKTEGDLFKYEDYYLGTGRERYAFAHSIDEALNIDWSMFQTLDVKPIQERLIKSFPIDLWSK